MKLAITISGKTIDAPFDGRFGRASAFCVIDTETNEWLIRENPALSAVGGAGVQAAQFVAQTGAGAVVSGAFGPNAFVTLQAAKIAMYTAPAGQAFSAQDVLEMFRKNELTKINEASGPSRHGGAR